LMFCDAPFPPEIKNMNKRTNPDTLYRRVIILGTIL
jgi:hypothetical protein